MKLQQVVDLFEFFLIKYVAKLTKPERKRFFKILRKSLEEK